MIRPLRRVHGRLAAALWLWPMLAALAILRRYLMS
jgi:hypothetical protein